MGIEDSPRPDPPRVVKPRRLGYVHRPLIAVDKDTVLTERGEVFTLSDLPTLTLTEPSSIVVCHHPASMVRELDKVLGENPLWQFRATPVERDCHGVNKKHVGKIRDTTISFFGLKGKNKKAGKYHYPVSPTSIALLTANEIRRSIPEPTDTVFKLMEWGKDLREFLREQDLVLRPTAGGIAGQLLRDKRFYPDPRRKVPKRHNAAAREYLPGNYYRLYHATPQYPYRATYLDQKNAHHNAASSIAFPHSDGLRAKGRFHSLQGSYVKHHSRHFERVIAEYGLFYLTLEVPQLDALRDFALPCLGYKAGTKNAYVFSNELPYLRELGVRVRHIIASWTSREHETGLNRYAEWAGEEVAGADTARKPWLKPTLLAPYGILAAKPKHVAFGYKQAKNSVEKQYPASPGFLTVQEKRQEHKSEPPTANVIARGMIEAETRLRSLRLARELTRQGHTVLAVYADSVFVTSDTELPLLPEPWRVEAHLTNLRFHSSTAFSSNELTKTPGVPKGKRIGRRLPPRPKGKVVPSG